MLDYIWVGMIIISVVYSVFTGKADILSKSIMIGIDTAKDLIFSVGSLMCFWCGIMKIAEKSGFTKIVCRLLKPITKLLFPDLDSNSPAVRAISMNMTANLLGLANAATPLGLTAAREICKLNADKGKISKDLAMLVVLNTASIGLIPTTVIALRNGAGAVNPFDVVVPTIIASFLGLLVGVVLIKLFYLKEGKK